MRIRANECSGTLDGVNDDRATLKIHDHLGAMVRQVAMTRDQRNASKWHLAESVALGGLHAATAVVRFGDGTSESLPASMFASTAPIKTLSL